MVRVFASDNPTNSRYVNLTVLLLCRVIDPSALSRRVAGDVSGSNILTRLGMVDLDPKKYFDSVNACAFNPDARLAQNPNITPSIIFTTKQGRVFQFAPILDRDSTGALKGGIREVRQWRGGLGSQLENCATDPMTGMMYMSEETVGVWAYDLGAANFPDIPRPAFAPDNTFSVNLRAEGSPSLVDSTMLINRQGKLQGNVEGIGLYFPQGSVADDPARRRGYIVVSNQGANSFSIYETIRPWKFIGKFSLEGSARGDAVTKSESLAVDSTPLGDFTRGALIVQDDATSSPDAQDPARSGLGATGSFKVVDWSKIEQAVREHLRGEM
jgi:myo-inositol-hexaphosphate 3-phosphohydrolase